MNNAFNASRCIKTWNEVAAPADAQKTDPAKWTGIHKPVTGNDLVRRFRDGR